MQVIFLFAFVGSIFSLKQASFRYQSSISKCCPSQFQLEVVSHSGKSVKYECIWDKVAISVGTSVPFMSYHIHLPNTINIPHCENIMTQNIHLNTSHNELALPLINNNYCIDVLRGEYVVLKCESANPHHQANKKIVGFKKCCDMNSAYNIYTKECTKLLNMSKRERAFDTILKKQTTIFKIGDLNCDPHTEVLMEYSSVEYGLKLINSSVYFENGEIFRPLSFCFDFVETSVSQLIYYPYNPSNWVIKVCRPKSVCDSNHCGKKCCPIGEYLTMDHKCEKEKNHFKYQQHKHIHSDAIPKATSPGFGIFHYFDCIEQMSLIATGPKNENFVSLRNDFIFLPPNKHFESEETFCIENYEYDDNSFEIKKFDCSYRRREEFKNISHAVFRSVSCSFLIFTMIVYFGVPKLLNLHGKTLVGYLSCSAVGQLILAIIKFNASSIFKHCMPLAYTVYFSFLGSFAWLNVMCYDIYWTLTSVRIRPSKNKIKNWKRYIWYSFYGWGIPIAFTLFVYYMDKFKILSSKFQPHLGVRSCWFGGLEGYICYFFLPFICHVLVNLSLFYVTTRYFNQVKGQLHSLNQEVSMEQICRNHRAALKMNSKLFIVMGVPWSFELLDMAYPDSKELCWVWEILNMSMGICVCSIFVFKRSVINALKQKFGCKILKPLRISSIKTTSTLISSTAPQTIRNM